MNTFFQAVGDTVMEHGGIIDKYIGDCVRVNHWSQQTFMYFHAIGNGVMECSDASGRVRIIDDIDAHFIGRVR